MTRLPRLAVGTAQPGASGGVMVWALLDALERRGLKVQTFFSRACFVPQEGATAITGLFPRHLDSWLMPPELGRDIFLRAAANSDIAVVDGRYGSALSAAESSGGNLETLCEWLDLPRLAVIDATLLADCKLPPRPAQLDGVLLDRVSSVARLSQLQTQFESLWGVPVLGSLPELAEVRSQIEQQPPSGQIDRSLFRALGDYFVERSRVDRIVRLASNRDFAYRVPATPAAQPSRHSVHVAVAYDDAFHCYFPDTLDLLEFKGAKVSDFSPLRDERLPQGAEVVYLGCGRPERFARELAANDCMAVALRDHVRNGGRVYAEGGGLAYLCQSMITTEGETLPMIGAMPAVARMNVDNSPPQALEITLGSDTWLGAAGATLRGYLHGRWTIESAGALDRVAGGSAGELYLCRHRNAIGSRMHLNFAAQPQALDRFFGRSSPDLDLAAAT